MKTLFKIVASVFFLLVGLVGLGMTLCGVRVAFKSMPGHGQTWSPELQMVGAIVLVASAIGVGLMWGAWVLVRELWPRGQATGVDGRGADGAGRP